MRFSIAIASAFCALEATALRLQPRNIGEVEALIKPARSQRSLAKRAEDDEFDLTLLYPERNISVPVDFFHNESRYEPHSNDSFDLRYWFDASYYKPGGPVFVLLGGETDGEGRLPFLQKGIVHQVIKATGGVGVILEHRYYGKSFPTPDLKTENLRFLSTEQSLAEINYFARNVKFEGIDDDLTAPNTPWIVYGGSYAGAQAAFMRLVYPETFWGAISSSGVTVAIIDYWQYMEPARLFAAPDCVKATQTFVDVFDGIVLNETNADKIQSLKEVFGADNFTDTRDLAFQLTYMNYLQSTNWDPALDYSGLYDFCNNITSEEPINEASRDTVAGLVSAAGWGDNPYAQNVTLNMAAYFNMTTLESWRGSNLTQDQYFSQVNETQWKQYTDLKNYGYTSWNYQVCTEWGYFQTGNTPPEIMPLYSRILDVEYLSFFCGAQFNLTSPPDIWQVNKYGNYTVDYPRLAHLGGNADVWRPATPLWYPDHKESTTSEPWLLISHGVHHWEENGIFPNETTPETPPAQVVYAQQFLKNFVIDWLDEFAEQKQRSEL